MTEPTSAAIQAEIPQIECEIEVFREGVLSSVGHDLVLTATRAKLTVDFSPSRQPSHVSLWIGADSLRVKVARRDGRDMPGALSASDLRKVETSVSREILRASKHPDVRFDAGHVESAGGAWRVHGTLALRGVSRPIHTEVRERGADLEARVALLQTDFGITPYRAMLGALRVCDELIVTLRWRGGAELLRKARSDP